MPTSSITPELLKSLCDPALFPVQTGTVQLIQTHISWLFLTDTHVFKLKKPVNFGFLDFSTLAQRRFYCFEELRLNRRLCPDIYERVIALHETASGASFVSGTAVIDYAVMMKRLPADRMLDRLVESGTVSKNDIEIVAHRIAAFHSGAATSAHISTFGSIEQLTFNWQENFDQTLPFRNTTLPLEVYETIRTYVEAFIDAHGALFVERLAHGFIRECDGDIHLGNICLLDTTAYIFDCIEFNERFRCSDTSADIAFLLMDLDFHRRPDLAEAALSAYITASGDQECVKLIPFYKVYRAFVRGKVESLKLLDSGIGDDEHSVAESRALRYFRLAQGYCLKSRLPLTLFITCGTMGSGKSTLTDQLAFELGLTVFSSDSVRKQMAGLESETSVHVPYGEGIYSQEMNRATYRRLEQLAGNELVSGRSVMIDAGFGSRAERIAFASLAASYQAQFLILFVQCDQDHQKERLRERLLKGASVSDGRVELLDRQKSVFEPPDDSEGVVIPCPTSGTTEHALSGAVQRILPCGTIPPNKKRR